MPFKERPLERAVMQLVRRRVDSFHFVEDDPLVCKWLGRVVHLIVPPLLLEDEWALLRVKHARKVARVEVDADQVVKVLLVLRRDGVPDATHKARASECALMDADGRRDQIRSDQIRSDRSRSE